MDVDDAILDFALQNAIRYKGRANPGAIIGKILGDFPEWKTKMKELSIKIQDHVKKVNSMSPDEQQVLLEERAPEMLEKKEQPKKVLKELDDTSGKVIMRFAPSPSGPMHLGHIMTGGLTSLYAKKYDAQFILRIEDTNSDNIYPPAYELLPNDAEWIFGNVTDVWIQSDRIEIYYSYAEKFLEKEAVYVCTCSPEEFKECSTEKKNCPCRDLPSEEHKKRWKKMFDKENGFKEGEAVLRFKADMTDKNPAMRDFPLIRINDSEHPKTGTKYRVWPLMNFSVWTDDVEASMTHIIRGKDHADNAKRQKLMYDVMNLPVPKNYFTGRYQFLGIELSSSKTREKIELGEYEGWEDIRLPFLGALRRRGYQKQAFMQYVEEVGLSPVDKKVSAEEFFKTLDTFNREIIDSSADRFFMIHEGVKISIADSPEKEVEMDLHPDNKKGGRKMKTNGEFIIQKSDFERIEKGKLYRLMNCLNFEKVESGFKFHSEEFSKYKDKGALIMHWLPAGEDLEKINILMPNNKKLSCLAEPAIKKVKTDSIVQFERFGFCRLDNNTEGLSFWFTHK